MGYVLKNIDTGKFVAPPGSLKSYTADALKAQRFRTRETAENHRCGNERIIDFDSLAGPMA